MWTSSNPAHFMSASDKPAERELLRDISLLYVEDEPITREVVSELLSKRVARLHVAADGAQGLEIFRTAHPDLVLTDIGMPHLDGLEMAAAIKAISPATPIIVTTARQESDLLMRAIDVGVDKFLVKPVAARALYETLAASYQPVRMARRLRESEERYRLMMQQAADGIFLAEQSGVLVEANPRACLMLGFECEELLGRNLRTLVPDELLEQVDDSIRRLVSGGKIMAESRLRRKTGSFVDVEVSAALLENGLLMMTVRDITRRKQTQQTLKENEEKFRLITEGIGDLIALVDTSGKRLYNSPSYQQILGKVPLIGTDSFQEIHPDDRERMRELFNATVSSGVGRQANYRFLLEGGNIRHIESNASVIKDAHGVPSKVIIVSRDVTERKLAEDALAASEQRLSTVLDALDAVVFVAELDSFEIVFANRHAREIFGGDLVGRVCWRVFQCGDGAPCEFCAHHSLLDGDGQPNGIHVWESYNLATRRWRQVRDQAIRWVDGRLVRMEIATDITPLKEVEAALRDSERNLAEAQRIARLGSWEWQVGAPHVTYSAQTARMLALPDEPRRCDTDVFHRGIVAGDHVTFLYALEDALREKRPFEVEYRIGTPEGAVRYIHSLAEIDYGDDGRPLRLYGSIQDVTDQRALEETILDIGENVRRTIGQELHDGLGQHLTGMGFVARTLQSRLTEKGLDEAADAARIVAAVANAIEQTRTLAKGLFPVELDENGLVPALEMLAGNTRALFGVDCTFQAGTGVLSFPPEESIHLYRITQEAISNAIRHGKATTIAISLLPSDDNVNLTITDDGVGVAGEVERRGMGMRIMEYRARLIGATLRISAAPRGGTIVTIR